MQYPLYSVGQRLITQFTCVGALRRVLVLVQVVQKQLVRNEVTLITRIYDFDWLVWMHRLHMNCVVMSRVDLTLTVSTLVDVLFPP